MYQIVSNELYHYGVKGQKWGVRRYQNADGTLTAEGKARYGDVKTMKKEARAEYRTDNKKAFELGRQATIDSHASYIADKKALKAQVRYDKKPTARRLNKLEAKQRTANRLDAKANESKKDAEKHVSELVQKYGSEAVRNLGIDRKGRVSEQISTKGEMATAAILSTIGTAAIFALGGYGAAMVSPKSASQLGREEYKRTLKEEKKAQRSLH